MATLAIKFGKVHKSVWSMSTMLDGFLGAAWNSSRFQKIRIRDGSGAGNPRPHRGSAPHQEKIPIPNGDGDEDGDINKSPSGDGDGEGAKIYPVPIPTSLLEEISLFQCPFPHPRLGKNPYPCPCILV